MDKMMEYSSTKQIFMTSWIFVHGYNYMTYLYTFFFVEKVDINLNAGWISITKKLSKISASNPCGLQQL